MLLVGDGGEEYMYKGCAVAVLPPSCNAGSLYLFCKLCLHLYVKFLYLAISSTLSLPGRLGTTSGSAEDSLEIFPKLSCWGKRPLPDISAVQSHAYFIGGSWKQAPEIQKSFVKAMRLYQVINFGIFH